MATTTTNFGWDIPQSTDLVKDGATAIAALGQDIDTAFVDFKGGTTGQVLKKTSNTDLDVEWGTASSGLTLINTTSFSGVASQNFQSVFSSTYDSYRIILNLTAAASSAALLFGRVITGTNTVDSATNYYAASNGVNWSNTAVNQNDITAASWVLGRIATADTGYSKFNFDVLSPNLAQYAVFLGGLSGVTSTVPFHSHGAFWHVTNNIVTGFQLRADTGTITGNVSIYGYSK
jgi:hypothetical protein